MVSEFSTCQACLNKGNKLYLKFKNRRVNGLSSMAFEAADDCAEDFFSDGHLLGVVVPCSLTEEDIQFHSPNYAQKKKINDKCYGPRPY